MAWESTPTAGLASLQGWGALARALAGASGLVPVVLVVDGPCLGGIALVLGLADVVVMTAEATAFVNGPQASARITGSATLDADLLGGSWVHGARTGVADLVVDDIDEAFDAVADLLDHLPPNNREAPPTVAAGDPANRPTRAAADAVPTDGRASYDVRGVITDVVDDREFLELRARFGTSVVTGPGPRGRDPRRRRGQPAQPAGGGTGHRGIAEGRPLRPLLRRLRTAASSRWSTRPASVPAATRSGGA